MANFAPDWQALARDSGIRCIPWYVRLYRRARLALLAWRVRKFGVPPVPRDKFEASVAKWRGTGIGPGEPIKIRLED